MMLPKGRPEFALFGGVGIHYGSQPNLDELPPVILAFVLDARGSVQNVTVLEGSGNKRYDAAVVEFLRHARWESPATLDGTPTPVLAYFRYSIKIYGGD
jgi:TonB family protein